MEVALSPHIMLFVLQLAMSIMNFMTVWLMKIVSIIFLNIGDESESICNSNTKKATVILVLRLQVLKIVTPTSIAMI